MRWIIYILSFFWKIYIAIIFCVFAVLLYPVFILLLSVKKWRKKTFNVFTFWSWVIRVLCFYPVKRIIDSPIPKGPYIVVANHTSYLDIFLMYSILPKYPFVFLGKSEILSYPLIGTFFKDLNVPVDRKNKKKSRKSYFEAIKKVEQGYSLIIFPEGGYGSKGLPKMRPFKQGSFRLAKTLNVPLIPITFTNNFKLFSDPTLFKATAHPGFVRTYIHPHISVEEIQKMEISELCDYCFDIINAPLLKEYPHLKDTH